MATRAGGAIVAQVGKLQEARVSLEKKLGFPVAASLHKQLLLVAAPPSEVDEAKVPARWLGFPVEVRKVKAAPEKKKR